MIVMGVGLALILNFTVMANARESQKWASTSGTITESEVVTTGSGDSQMYRPHVIYSFEVGGEEFTSAKVSTDGTWDSKWARSAQKRVNRYPMGEEVEVFYNPDLPSQSLLETSVPAFFSIPLLE